MVVHVFFVSTRISHLLQQIPSPWNMAVNTEQPMTAYLGDVITLPCTFSISPNSYYSLLWSLNGSEIIQCGIICSEISSGRRLLEVEREDSMSRLTIEDVRWRDAGDYSCTIHSEQGMRTSPNLLLTVKGNFSHRVYIQVCPVRATWNNFLDVQLWNVAISWPVA